MGNWIVEGQMIIFFALIFIGFFLYKSKHLSDETARQLSWIVVNITNPITLLCAALKDENKVPASELGVAFGCFVLMYIILIPLSFVIPLVLLSTGICFFF